MQMRQDGNIFARAFNVAGLVARDIVPLNSVNALASVLKLHGVRGIDEDTNEPVIGVATEELEREFPELVLRLDNEDGSLRGKGINYMMFTAPIIEAIRELNDRLTAVENASS